MRDPILAPASYARALAATAQMTVSELNQSATARRAWGATQDDTTECVVLIVNEEDTLGDIAAALLKARRSKAVAA